MKHQLRLGIFLIFFFNSFIIFSQQLTLKDLFLLQYKDLEFVNNYINNKGWELNESKVNDEGSFFDYAKMVSWSLNKNTWDNKAQGWFYLYLYDDYDNAIGYQTLQDNFIKLKKEAEKANFKITNTEVEDNKIVTTFKLEPLKISFTTSKYQDDYSYSTETYYYVEIYNYKDIAIVTILR